MKYSLLNLHKLPLLALMCFVPGIANAYMGPGAGISVIGSILAIIAAVIVAVLGFLWFPIKRLLRNRRKKANIEDNE